MIFQGILCSLIMSCDGENSLPCPPLTSPAPPTLWLSLSPRHFLFLFVDSPSCVSSIGRLSLLVLRLFVSCQFFFLLFWVVFFSFFFLELASRCRLSCLGRSSAPYTGRGWNKHSWECQPSHIFFKLTFCYFFVFYLFILFTFYFFIFQEQKSVWVCSRCHLKPIRHKRVRCSCHSTSKETHR